MKCESCKENDMKYIRDIKTPNGVTNICLCEECDKVYPTNTKEKVA